VLKPTTIKKSIYYEAFGEYYLVHFWWIDYRF